MGGNTSKSKTLTQYNDTIVNQTDISTLNTTINQQSTTASISAAQSCSQSDLENNNITIQNINAAGNFNFSGGIQSNTGMLTFSCIQKSNVIISMANTIQSAVGGNTSKPITTATTYTLRCLDLTGATKTKTAKVNILPSFQEL